MRLRTRLQVVLAAAAAALVMAACSGFGDEWTVRKGGTAPDFSLTDIAGQPRSLSRAEGKVVALFLFATWCGPCVAELKDLEANHLNDLKKAGVEVLAIGTGDNEAAVAKFASTHGLTFPLLPDPGATVQPRYAGRGIPRSILIDKQGRVHEMHLGYSPESLARMVENAKTLAAK